MNTIMTLTDFLLARIAEDEAVARAMDEASDPLDWSEPGDPAIGLAGPVDGPAGYEAIVIDPARVLAECEAKRRIVELHQSWPVLVDGPPELEQLEDAADANAMTLRVSQRLAWLTQQEYRARFGDEPPTAPMLAALAAVYAGHPDYREEWRP